MSRYRFIEAHRGQYPVRLLCQLVEVPASGYYTWQQIQQQVVAKPEPAWETALVKAFGVHKRCYGTRRLRVELRRKGYRIGRQQLRTAMRRRGLHALQPKAFTPRTTDSTHGLRCAPNRLLDQPKPTQANRVWISDITYLPLANGDIVSASTMAIKATAFTPAAASRALTEAEIQGIIQDFGQATRRAIEAGFDGVELHGTHGLLLQNFPSPFFNQRTDEWGGSLENRLRFPLAVVAEVQSIIQEHATGPFLLGYRISPDEPQAGGLRIADVYELLDRLIALDIDYAHISLPSVLTTKPVDSEDDELVIEGILARVNGRLPIISAGYIRTPDEARQALDLGLAVVAVGQALVVNPNWLELAAAGREDEITGALQPSTVEEKRIPGKLWGIIQVATGWFNVAAE